MATGAAPPTGGRRRRLSYGTRINLALAAALVLLVVLAVGSYLTITSLLRASEAESRSRDAVLRVERLVTLVKTAESWQRRFLLTGDDEDLRAYVNARDAALEAAVEARASGLSEPQRMVALEESIRKRVDGMELAAQARVRSGLEAATALLTSDANRELRETIDRQLDSLKAAETDTLRASSASTRERARLLWILIPVGGALSVGVLAWALVLVNLYHRARRAAERRLRASETFVREVVDAVPALIAYADAERRVRFHNRAYEESLGRRGGEIDGRPLEEVLGAQAYAQVRDKIDQAYDGYTVTYERTGLTPMGLVHDYEIKYVPRYGEGRDEGRVVGVYALGNDITEFKRIDRMKSEFVSTVSHELRTPLTSIRGSLGLIAGGVAGPVPDKARSLVAIARDNCERLIRLINDILDSEKIDAGQLRLEVRPQPMRPLLEQALRDNEAFAAQHQAALALHAPDEDVVAAVDTDRIAQVATNLLSNACKFSPPGTTVDVVLSVREGRARVEVRDRGPGIAPEFRQRIFRKFSQADASDTRQKGGTGLGLNISRALVERMGGVMDFETPAEGGSVFFFELPLVRGTAAPAPVPTPAPPADAPRRTRPRVLVCEDDSDVARLIAMMLDQGGFDADLAPSAEAALDRLAVGGYAAMTVDLRLPGRDGISLIRAVRADVRFAHLPIVVVSANVEQGRLRLKRHPLIVSGWLGKPIDQDGLVRGLRRAIQDMSGERPRILHVEDDRHIQQITAAIGEDLATFVEATTLDEARDQLRSGNVSAVLLDLDLGSGERGSALFRDLDTLAPGVPVVIFTATDVSDDERERAAAILVKSDASNEKVRDTLARVLDDKR